MTFATPAYVPENWASMRQAIFAWADAEMVRLGFTAGERVVFTDQRVAHPPKPYVAIALLTPPTPRGHAERSSRRDVAVRVAAVLNATTYTVTINGTDITFLSDANATDAEIRDGLVAAINASSEPVTASPLGLAPFDTDTLLILADDQSVLFTIAVDANLACKIVHATFGDQFTVWQIDVIADEAAPDDPDPVTNADAAVRIATTLHASIQASRTIETFRDAGWGFEFVSATRRIPNFIGQNWEDRAGFDAQLTCRSRDVELLDWIEDATLDSSIVGSFA